ncbi:hypothetical protein Hanom_Chr03g00231191 [Helianthus anomalus]
MERQGIIHVSTEFSLFSPLNLQILKVFLKIFKCSSSFFKISSSVSQISSRTSYYDRTECIEDVVEVEETGGVMPPLKWEEGLFEQVVRGHQFAREWDAFYPAKGQTTLTPLRVILRYSPTFLVTGTYGFLRRTSLLQSNIVFYSFATCGSKRLLLNPPKSSHDKKGIFFYIHEEVIPIAMDFRDPTPIPKETLKIPKGVAWYGKLSALPNRTFGEQVLVAAGMSDKWPNTRTDVPVLILDGVGMCPVHDDEELWYEQIQDNFMYPPADTFAASPTSTEGAHILNLMSCRAITPAVEEVVLLSSGEYIASSKHGLNSPSYVFAGSLRELGVDPDC